MELSDEDKERIRAEERFRAETRAQAEHELRQPRIAPQTAQAKNVEAVVFILASIAGFVVLAILYATCRGMLHNS